MVKIFGHRFGGPSRADRAASMVIGGSAGNFGSGVAGAISASKLHSANGLFVSDPAQYIKDHACVLGEGIQGIGQKTGISESFNITKFGTRGENYIPTGSNRLTVQLDVNPENPPVPKIRVIQSSGGKEVCFLPWQDSKCTAMLVSGSADLFLTGPLEGCHVYLAAKAGFPPMALHVNANDQPGKSGLVRKDQDAINAASAKGYRLTRRLASTDYQFPAFVWGVKAGSEWFVYVHSSPHGAQFSNLAVGAV